MTGNTVANGTSEGGRLAMVPGCNPYTGSSDPWNRLNSACFTAPQPGSLGLESDINSLYAPGFVNFDMSLQKQFAKNPYTNGVLTNKTGFGTVNTQLSSNTAALPGPPRILQLVVRVQF